MHYSSGISQEELYDAVRGYWVASLKSIKNKKVKYVFGVYNSVIVAVYKPDEWHYGREMVDVPQKSILTAEDYKRLENRVYFVCKNHSELDEEGMFYLNKSIKNLWTGKFLKMVMMRIFLHFL